MTHNRKLTILIPSCDTYQDLWQPLTYSLDTFWPDCPYKVFLGSNTKKLNHPKIRTILSGVDKDWSTNLLAYLGNITTPFVYIWLDDSFAVERVEKDMFENALDFMIEKKAKHLHTTNSPKTDTILPGGKYGEYLKGAPYRANVQGFWDRQYLEKLLLPGENPWNFEIHGSYRTSYDEGFYGPLSPVKKYINVVRKGKITEEAYAACRRLHIPLNTSERPVNGGMGLIHSFIQNTLFDSIIQLPWNFRVKTMDALRKIFISY